jgi:tetratricopeptide (TPR) repeat protein
LKAMKTLLACALFAGCVSHRFPAGGRRSSSFFWSEYSSDHFILDSAADEADAARILTNFEALRAADLRFMAGEQQDFAGRIRIIAPPSDVLFALMPWRQSRRAFFVTRQIWEDTVIVVPAERALEELRVAAHEMAHAVSFFLYPEQRSWFSEGLAQFVETVASGSIDTAGELSANGSVGALPKIVGGVLEKDELPLPSERVFAWREGTDDAKNQNAYYAASWLLYHWLWATQRADLTAFQKRLADGAGFDEAWKLTFPELDPQNHDQMAALDSVLFAYQKAGHFASEKNAAVAARVVPRRGFISSADVRIWLLEFWYDAPTDRDERVRAYGAQIDKAIKEDPTNARALLWKATLDKTMTLQKAREIVQNARLQVDAWLALGRLSTDAAEKEEAFIKAVSLREDCAGCQNELAWFLLEHGRAKEALPHANRAVDLMPWNASAIDTLAVVALKLEHCPEALQLERRAVRIATTSGGRVSATMEKNLREVNERCAK